MLYLCTDHAEQQKQLEIQFSNKHNYYAIPQQHSYCVAEMLTSISYEFFQNHMPTVVSKIKEMLVSSFSNTYSLNTFREIMAILKKEKDEMRLFKDYLIEMNTVFAQSHNQTHLQNGQSDSLNDDGIFLQTLKGQSHLPHNLQEDQLPIFSQLQLKCDSQQTETQKTMQSDLCSSKLEAVTPLSLSLSGTAKLSTFFKQETFNREQWKTDRKRQEVQGKQSSQEMSSFRKRGSTILDRNRDLGRILVKQLQYDISRQINLARDNEHKHIQIQKHKYQQKIKSTLVNYKLRVRKLK